MSRRTLWPILGAVIAFKLLSPLISGADAHPVLKLKRSAPIQMAQTWGTTWTPQAKTEMETQLTKLAAESDVYLRSDQIVKTLDHLNQILKDNQRDAQGLLYRGRLYLLLAATKAEMGASALDYWVYQSEEVDPIYEKARQDFSTVIALSTENPQAEAEAYYYRAQTCPDCEELVADDLRKACQLGHAKACEQQKNN